MLYGVILPFLMGAFGVLQNTLNKRFAASMGMPLALLVNNLVLLACGLFVFALALAASDSMPELFRHKQGWDSVGWKHVLPGILGFLIIAILPLTIEKVGAMRVFIMIIAAQLVVSALWDRYVEALPVSPLRIAGGALTLLGAALAAL